MIKRAFANRKVRMIKSEKGVVLIFAMSIIMALTLVGSTMVVRSMTESGVTRIDQNENRALSNAEAAMDRGLKNLYWGNEADIPSTSISRGHFWAELYGPSEDPSLSALQYRIVGHGSEESSQRSIELVTSRTEKSVFKYGVFADEGVQIQGNVRTDSFDSRDGAYNVGGNIGQNGDVGTNGTDADSIDFVGGTSFIDGQVTVGPGLADPESAVDNYNPTLISGGTTPWSDDQDLLSATEEFPLPHPDLPEGIVCDPYERINAETRILTGGHSYCYDELDITGGAIFTSDGIGGTVKIYITGSFNLAGNGSVFGVVNDPTKMLLIMVGPGSDAKIDDRLGGTSTFYGGMYAPEADLKIYGNAQIFGAVVGDSIQVEGNAQVHYDEAMEDIEDLTNRWENDVLFWREINPGE